MQKDTFSPKIKFWKRQKVMKNSSMSLQNLISLVKVVL